MSVTAAGGWSASGVAAGTKPSGDLDLALVLSERPASVAAAFTTNRARAAHILVCEPRVARGSSRGVLVSAGIANAGTGRAGVEDATRMAAETARLAGVPADDVLICCTGVIGGRIRVDEIVPGIEAAVKTLSPDGGADASRAILTTDTRPKTATRTVRRGGGTVTIGAMAKGAGMIAPALTPHATMLAFVTTDADAPAESLRRVLGRGLARSFNAVSVDGATSTNDTLLLFANGASGVDVRDDEEFEAAVHEVMAELAYAIVADGEGATKVVRIRVTGALSDEEASRAAREVANSVLFRAALWGGDPNWGRVVQAIGQAPVAFDADRVRVVVAGVPLAEDGVGTGREDEAAPGLGAAEVAVEADLGLGSGRGEILTCDLSPDYVRFNADYTT